MKKINSFLIALGILGLSSCSSDDDGLVNPLSNPNEVKFSTTIESNNRAAGTQWDPGDAIGVYALNAGEALSSAAIYNGKENIKFTTAGNGNFLAASTTILFPETGNLDFVAYYPHQPEITDYAYAINVTDQTLPAKIDLLYSDDAKGMNASNTPVNMLFKHKLSQLILSITAGDGITSLDGLTAKIENMIVNGSMSLATGNVAIGSTVATINPLLNVAGTSGSAGAILVPGQSLNAAKITFMLNGQTFEWTPTTQALESGKKYSYKLQLSTSGITTVQPQATIEDWGDGYIGLDDIILTPDDTPQFTADKTSATIAASGTLSSTINLITESTQGWTVSSDQAWLTANLTSGTGSSPIIITAEANTGTTSRTATLTITPTGTTTFTAISVTVTQEGEVSVSNTLFPGSDFNDWSTFLSSINSGTLPTAVTAYTMHNATGGRNGSGALHFNGTTGSSNAYIYTALVPSGFSTAGKSKITFYIKGTAAKSLSMNVYIGTANVMGTDYKCYNLGACTGEATLDPTDANAYTGAVSVSDWTKITLDISSLTTNSTIGQYLFAMKVGSGSLYNLLVDDITLE